MTDIHEIILYICCLYDCTSTHRGVIYGWCTGVKTLNRIKYFVTIHIVCASLEVNSTLFYPIEWCIYYLIVYQSYSYQKSKIHYLKSCNYVWTRNNGVLERNIIHIDDVTLWYNPRSSNKFLYIFVDKYPHG